ncbi:hypothetical protein UFOVP1008_16 [uncultured Caudovirales phage]|uniref:Uncharacterized protein n=1 Tax=uncultured Caudovirales phage TaxID=2100421 RepID=A0A6J5Q7U9_9CAUD|nr:hypothetical protein UFOVP498_24 [uncultured Caudovirales phage]CAB4177591.1 hypothetical protein UFOVP1008_16 [uncultured Caudovirales phage]CAB4187333.1 hypothetical protein UFOVP1160_30 [uncultured Caudovirales phage]CAB4199894.1 hypothetical protein UFOVP1352_20 [uncultured Caudovirales phage]
MISEVILTKYIPADHKFDARITARFAMWSGWVKIPFPYRIDSQEARYRAAAEFLIADSGLDMAIVAGGITPQGWTFIATYKGSGGCVDPRGES